MSLFPLPSKVRKRIDKIRRRVTYGKATMKKEHSTWLIGMFLSNPEKMVALASGT